MKNLIDDPKGKINTNQLRGNTSGLYKGVNLPVEFVHLHSNASFFPINVRGRSASHLHIADNF